MIPVTKPYIPNKKKLFKRIEQIHKNEWFTNFGPFHEELTHKLEEYLGVKNLLLVSNGTLALQIAYKSLGLKDIVITSPYSFVATTSTLVWERIEPRFVDINKTNLSLSFSNLKRQDLTNVSGIVGVHVFGNPGDTHLIDAYAKKNRLKVVYDGAHAFGVKKNGRSILLSGDASTLSFHATKVFHTIEGGGIVFKDKKFFEIAKRLANFGLDLGKNIRGVGINSKLNEYQCAVGLTILEDIDLIIERRRAILDRYEKILGNYFEMPIWDKNIERNGAYAPIFLKDERETKRVLKKLLQEGIQTRRYFYPSLNQLEYLPENISCPHSESLAKRSLCLPLYTSMNRKEQDRVIELLLNI